MFAPVVVGQWQRGLHGPGEVGKPLVGGHLARASLFRRGTGNVLPWADRNTYLKRCLARASRNAQAYLTINLQSNVMIEMQYIYS